VLHCGGSGPAVVAAGEHTWPQSLDIMGWEVAPDGLKPIFSRDIPRLVADKLGVVARDFLGEHGLAPTDIDRFVCHPGGPKVIDALEHAFGLSPGVLNDARDVLREYGNMSAASVLFVLERMVAQNWRRALMTALGPGFTAGFVVLGKG
jgi:alkylresorcinol/alkylpyrone synthase